MNENMPFPKKKKKIKFKTTLDLIKGFKQIKYQRLILTCAPISELPSNISTMAAAAVGFEQLHIELRTILKNRI